MIETIVSLVGAGAGCWAGVAAHDHFRPEEKGWVGLRGAAALGGAMAGAYLGTMAYQKFAGAPAIATGISAPSAAMIQPPTI